MKRAHLLPSDMLRLLHLLYLALSRSLFSLALTLLFFFFFCFFFFYPAKMLPRRETPATARSECLRAGFAPWGYKLFSISLSLSLSPARSLSLSLSLSTRIAPPRGGCPEGHARIHSPARDEPRPRCHREALTVSAHWPSCRVGVQNRHEEQLFLSFVLSFLLSWGLGPKPRASATAHGQFSIRCGSAVDQMQSFQHTCENMLADTVLENKEQADTETDLPNKQIRVPSSTYVVQPANRKT